MIYKNLNQAFVEQLSHLKSSGNIVNSRGSKQIEITFVNMVIEDPTQLDIEVPIRKFNKDYAIGEWLWYISGNQKSNNIGKIASIWKDISDSYGEVESNYGTYLFNYQKDFTQWNWVIEELINDSDSRRATIAINQPYHKTQNKKDYPCTQYIQFFIRENKLDMGVYMRSNDAVFGFCNDVFTFCLFQQLMLNELNSRGFNLELGKYYHSAGSFHLYERHFKMMDTILNNYYLKAIKDGYPETKKTSLKEGLTFRKLISLRGEMPQKDMTKKEIFDFINSQKGVLFR